MSVSTHVWGCPCVHRSQSRVWMSPSHPPCIQPLRAGVTGMPWTPGLLHRCWNSSPLDCIANTVNRWAISLVPHDEIFFYFFWNHPSSKTEAKTRRGRLEMKPSIKAVTCAVVLAPTKNATKRVLSQPGLHSEIPCQQKAKKVTKESRTGQPQ